MIVSPGRLTATHVRLLTLLLATVCPGGIGYAEDPVRPEVEVRARGIFPGEVIRIAITPDRTLLELSGTVFGKIFPFESNEGSPAWDGLVGIDLDVKPGAYEVFLEAAALDGRAITFAPIPVQVLKKTFPTRELTVDSQYVNPPAEALERIRSESRRVSGILSAVSPERLWRGGFTLPVPGEATSSFGKRSILNGQPRSPHSGTDFQANEGTPVQAPNRGVVVLAENLYFAGNTIILDHGQGLYSYFAHLSSFAVREGDKVEKSQIIGKVGATGRVTGPHLHWAVRLVEARVDPLSLIEAVAVGDSR